MQNSKVYAYYVFALLWLVMILKMVDLQMISVLLPAIIAPSLSTILQYKRKNSMHFLITGHTGFKGAWLIALLRERGHRVSGISLSAENGSLFKIGKMANFLEKSNFC